MATGGAKRTTLALGAILVVASAAGAGYWWWTGPRAREEAKRAAAAALADFELCLLGETGLEPAVARRRLRGLTLAGELGAELPQGWPMECAAHLESAEARIRPLGDEGLIELSSRLRVQARSLGRAQLRDTPDAYDRLEQTLRVIRAAPLPDAEPTAEPPTLPPARASLAQGELPVLGEGAAVFLQETDAPGLIVQGRDDDADATTVTACALLADGADDVRCGPPRRFEGRASFRLLARDGTAPLVVGDVLANPEESTLFDAETWAPHGPFLRAGFARDGLVHGVSLREPGKPTLAIRRAAGGGVTRETLEPPFVGAQPTDALVADRLAAVRWEEPGKRVEARVYAIDDEGVYRPTAALEVVGALSRICPTDDGFALVCGMGGRVVVDFVPGEGERARHELEPGAHADARCVDGGVSFTGARRAEGEARGWTIERTRCRPEGCAIATATVAAPDLVGEDAHFDVLDLGDRVAIVMGGAASPVLASVAPLEALPEATRHVVVDAVRFGGPSVRQRLLLPHREGALLSLRGEDRVRAVILSPEGAPRPATLTSFEE